MHHANTSHIVKVDRITRCKRCGGEIAWLTNAAGKWYPVNYHGLGLDGEMVVGKLDFHRCAETKPASPTQATALQK